MASELISKTLIGNAAETTIDDGVYILVERNGFLYKIPTATYVFQEEGSIGYSDNNFTDEYKAALDNLIFTKVYINNFKNNIGNIQRGVTINTVEFTWDINIIPVALSLKDENSGAVYPISISATSCTLDDVSITDTTKFTLTAQNEDGLEIIASTSIVFCNDVYYGVSDITDLSTLSFMDNLDKIVQPLRDNIFTVTAPKNNYIYYAVPSSYGECIFEVFKLQGGFTEPYVTKITNSYGYTEDYNIYRSENHSLGTITVTVL